MHRLPLVILSGLSRVICLGRGAVVVLRRCARRAPAVRSDGRSSTATNLAGQTTERRPEAKDLSLVRAGVWQPTRG